jgi:hypothetical protein
LDALFAQLPLDPTKHAARGAGDGLTISLTKSIRNAAYISPVRRRVPDHTINNNKFRIIEEYTPQIKMMKAEEIKVFISGKDSTCDECKESLDRHAWITLNREKGALCLACGDLDHLVYLPAGDAALTRRARKHSTLFAVVLKWNRARKRYERKGLLVEERALEHAEKECLADEDVRARRKKREAARRAELDQEYIKDFGQRIMELFPSCPLGRETVIAEHACLKYSGRVGRSAAAKDLRQKAIRLAVIAHIRHAETEYDELLAKGCERLESRLRIEAKVDRISTEWEGKK